MRGRTKALLRTPAETPDALKQEGWTLLSNIDRDERLEVITQLRQTESRVSLLIHGQIVECEIHDGTELDTRMKYTRPGDRGTSIAYLSDLLGGKEIQVLAKNFVWNRSSVQAVHRASTPEIPQSTLAHWVTLHENVSGDFPALWERLLKAGDLGQSNFYLVERSALKGAAPDDRDAVIAAIAKASTPLVRAELDESRDGNNQHRILFGTGPHPSSTTLDLLVRGRGGAQVLVEMRNQPLVASTRVELFTSSREYTPSAAPVMSVFDTPAETSEETTIETALSTPIQAILQVIGHNMTVHSIGRRQVTFRCEGHRAFLTMEDLKDELQNYGLNETDHKWNGNVTRIEDLYSAIFRCFKAQIDSQNNGQRQRLALQQWIDVSGLISPYIHIETDVHVTPPSFTASFHLGS